MAKFLKVIGTILMIGASPVLLVTTLALMDGNMQSLIAFGVSAQVFAVGFGLLVWGIALQHLQTTAENSGKTVALLQSMQAMQRERVGQ